MNPKIKIRGPFWEAEAEMLQLEVEDTIDFITAEYQQRPDQELPDGWASANKNDSIIRNVSNTFGKVALGGNRYFGININEGNNNRYTGFFCHYNNAEWQNYSYSGRFQKRRLPAGSPMTTSDIGFTIASGHHELNDSFYRLQTYTRTGLDNVTGQYFRLVSVKAGVRVTIADSDVPFENNGWYNFKIEFNQTDESNIIQAKIWESDHDEPGNYQIEAIDNEANRINAGTIGVWGSGNSIMYFADLRVELASIPLPIAQSLFVQKVNDTRFRSATIKALCWVSKIELKRMGMPLYWAKSNTANAPNIQTPDEVETHLESGEICSLLLQYDSKDGNRPSFRCLSGDISIDTIPSITTTDPKDQLFAFLNNRLPVLMPQVLDWLEEAPAADLDLRSGAAALVGRLTAHPGGITIFGKFTLPWMDNVEFTAPLQLSELQFEPGVTTGNRKFRLSIETNRLNTIERNDLIQASLKLSQFINPDLPINSINENGASPSWAVLELTDPTQVPILYWDYDQGLIADVQPLVVHFGRNRFSLLLSDQAPYAKDFPPNSMASILPASIRISKVLNKLIINFVAGTRPADNLGQMDYMATFSPRVVDVSASASIPDLTSFSSLSLSIVGPEKELRWNGPMRKLDVVLLKNLKIQVDDIFKTAIDKLINWRWEETFSLTDLNLVFDSIHLAEQLRLQQNIKEPKWQSGSDQPLEEPLLWAFMPLVDGWAQVPFPNISEQIYLDADLENSIPSTSTTGFFQGAVSWGNHYNKKNQVHQNETLWDINLINAAYIEGVLTLQPVPSDNYRLETIELEIQAPELTANGLIWLSNGKPNSKDALPDLADGVTGLQMVSLKNHQPQKELYPHPLSVFIQDLSFSCRFNENNTIRPTAKLGNLSFEIRPDKSAFKELMRLSILPKNIFYQIPALLWRRHSMLPMIQSLPLTQQQNNTNHPSSSRQLIPLTLQLTTDDIDFEIGWPQNWSFEVSGDNGAAQWPAYTGAFEPNREWPPEIPLVALSLPGLILQRKTAYSPLEIIHETVPGEEDLFSGGHLQYQYCFDLPYNDEVYFLSQLPGGRDSNGSSFLAPLHRKDYQGYWQKLANLFKLSATADTNLMVPIPPLVEGNSPIVQGLGNFVQPFILDAEAKVDLQNYPGSMTLYSLDGSIEKSVSGVTGFSLPLKLSDGNKLELIAEDDISPPDYELRGGSMLSVSTSDEVRDQVGLRRGFSQIINPNILQTSVGFEKKADGVIDYYKLTSSLQSFELLNDNSGGTWKFWFNNVPLQDSNGIFDRDNSIFRSTNAEDVNDPEGFDKNYNFLNAYEWRLNEVPVTSQPYLQFYNLHFYPITLEKLQLTAGVIDNLEIIGRLQLPLPNPKELAQLDNIVRIRYEKNGMGELVFTSIQLENGTSGTWPLAPESQAGNIIPVLHWQIAKSTVPNTLIISELQFVFFLFDEKWSVALPTSQTIDLTTASSELMNATYYFNEVVSDLFQPSELIILLNLTDGNHRLDLLSNLTLGDTNPSLAFKGQFLCYLLGDMARQIDWVSGKLFDQLPLKVTLADGVAPQLGDPEIHLHGNTLQLNWRDVDFNGLSAAYFLPGIALDMNKESPGFLAFSFEFLEGSNRQLTFHENRSDSFERNQETGIVLKMAIVEALLYCSWGEFLNKDTTITRSPSEIFNATVGRLHVGYTAQWVPSELPNSGTWSYSYLLNGQIELNNLISWPEALLSDNLAIPAGWQAGVSSPLNHVRHRIKILLNQQYIPSELLQNVSDSEPTSPILFRLTSGKAWVFPVVTEHRFIQVNYNTANQELSFAGSDKSYTVVQDIRMVSPDLFRNYFEVLEARERELAQESGFANQNGFVHFDNVEHAEEKANYTAMFDEILGTLEENSHTIFVEAGALHFVKREALPQLNNSDLQLLPYGIQSANLSQPDYFTASSPDDPIWTLMRNPFIGRLQSEADNLYTDPYPDTDRYILAPLFRLSHERGSGFANMPLLMMTNRSTDATSKNLELSTFYEMINSLHARLDPASLKENWYRLYHPVEEEELSSGLTSIMSTLSGVYARLSRQASMNQVMRGERKFYPPANQDSATTQTVADNLKWREDADLLFPSVQTIDGEVYPWFHINLSDLFNITAEEQFPAATLMSPKLSTTSETNLPHSFALSPYTGLSYRELTKDVQVLSSVELVCPDEKRSTFLPIASKMWENSPSQDEIFQWALQMHSSLLPEARIAILRFRNVFKDSTPGSTDLSSYYHFALLPLADSSNHLARKVLPLRSLVDNLRFREGQFGGGQIPNISSPGSYAPPLIAAFDPIHIDQPELKPETSDWPWGLSGWQARIKYLDSEQGQLGEIITAGSDYLLWWQGTQLTPQFQAASANNGIGGGLPAIFRAPAIKSLQTHLPKMPLPVDQQEVNWQPVLPGSLKLVLKGSRPGVFFAIRHQVQHQQISGVSSDSQFNSGSIPAQYRMPRPVSLPLNLVDKKEVALQTWASYFEPDQLIAKSVNPIDEAFFADTSETVLDLDSAQLAAKYGADVGALSYEELQTKFAAKRMRMELVFPEKGKIPEKWNGHLHFAVRHEGIDAADLEYWIKLTLMIGNEKYSYVKTGEDGSRPDLVLEFEPDQDNNSLLDNFRFQQDNVEVFALIGHSITEGLFHKLIFPLRSSNNNIIQLPLDLQFIHFEDPEYNRQLSSSSAIASVTTKEEIGGEDFLRRITISADRKEYNVGSELIMRFDWDDHSLSRGNFNLTFKRINDGEISELQLVSSLDPNTITAGKIIQFSLFDLRRDDLMALVPGDSLLLSLEIRPKSTDSFEEKKIEIALNIIGEPVIPTSDAAYALLRKEGVSVSCCRFARSPEAVRVEMINPHDLQTGVIRRRAIFHWRDIIRKETLVNYSMQKITADGATHFPVFP